MNFKILIKAFTSEFAKQIIVNKINYQSFSKNISSKIRGKSHRLNFPAFLHINSKFIWLTFRSWSDADEVTIKPLEKQIKKTET